MAFTLSVFLENKITRFEEVTASLRSERINIRSLSLTGMPHGWGILNLLVDQPERAYKLLSDKGNSVSMEEVIAVAMEDEAGGLDEMLLKIAKAGIHVENAYTRLIAEKNIAVLLLVVQDFIEAKKRLEANHVVVLDDKIVYGK
ncbi:hypothetical protein [Maribellus sp. YY47]|uniref:hypothetical protein n=1 Tax=Maribellus sp. YY47 TaxID=2929486 RepID=UPI00200088F7|nr:hypothetical protein [Maribellus sp. YY47]MCK3684111.1 hypothetical protein [Maribellus sp. YY47]